MVFAWITVVIVSLQLSIKHSGWYTRWVVHTGGGTHGGWYTRWVAHTVGGTHGGRHIRWETHTVGGTHSGWHTEWVIIIHLLSKISDEISNLSWK